MIWEGLGGTSLAAGDSGCGSADLNITFGTMLLPSLIDWEVNLIDLQSFVLSKKNLCSFLLPFKFLLSRGEAPDACELISTDH